MRRVLVIAVALATSPAAVAGARPKAWSRGRLTAGTPSKRVDTITRRPPGDPGLPGRSDHQRKESEIVRTRSVAGAAVSVSVVTGLVVAAILAPSAPGATNPVVHWATGSGHQDDVDAATGEVFNPTFSFSAVQYSDGTAEGNAQIASRKFTLDGVELVIHMRIDCLSILPDGKTAQLSGVITRTSFPFPDAPVGEIHRFSVQDNGEPGAGVDKFSGVPPNPLARECDDADFGQPEPGRVAPTRTVNRGNIQIR